MREQKGITLVALILTIVVLLILAVVSINAIQNTEIINHATNAGKKYNQAQKDENTLLGEYNSYFEGTGSNVGEDDEPSIGGVITFTVTFKDGSTVLGTKTYSGISGTTLETWVGSSYNTDGWYNMNFNIGRGTEWVGILVDDTEFTNVTWSWGAFNIWDYKVILSDGLNLEAENYDS